VSEPSGTDTNNDAKSSSNDKTLAEIFIVARKGTLTLPKTENKKKPSHKGNSKGFRNGGHEGTSRISKREICAAVTSGEGCLLQGKQSGHGLPEGTDCARIHCNRWEVRISDSATCRIQIINKNGI